MQLTRHTDPRLLSLQRKLKLTNAHAHLLGVLLDDVAPTREKMWRALREAGSFNQDWGSHISTLRDRIRAYATVSPLKREGVSARERILGYAINPEGRAALLALAAEPEPEEARDQPGDPRREWRLTPAQTVVARELMRDPIGASREALCKLLRQSGFPGTAKKTVDVHICRIRRRIAPFDLQIDNILGFGWRFTTSSFERLRAGGMVR